MTKRCLSSEKEKHQSSASPACSCSQLQLIDMYWKRFASTDFLLYQYAGQKYWCQAWINQRVLTILNTIRQPAMHVWPCTVCPATWCVKQGGSKSDELLRLQCDVVRQQQWVCFVTHVANSCVSEDLWVLQPSSCFNNTEPDPTCAIQEMQNICLDSSKVFASEPADAIAKQSFLIVKVVPITICLQFLQCPL